ncbi:hypothetical protein PV327_001874 [Microctonus hyperodae]|uniref:SH2 domain-containing protein n=1 Tax=Microctonus hyperodae TaxID=165561 RepID=A0AA39FEF5_MICHY|nr:hypothetical protein PV327_001874 [Microctonus hyperodae]
MMTVMCPNCRHRFPAPGCCNPDPQINGPTMQQSSSECTENYYNCSGLLVPRGYNNNNSNNNNTSNNGCFINAPTIINGPTIIQSMSHDSLNKIHTSSDGILDDSKLWIDQMKNIMKSTNCKMNSCDLTGSKMTIATPSIQSGGCVIQNNNSDIIIQSPHIEIKPKLSGGGYLLVQKKLSTEDLSSSEINFTDDHYSEALNGVRCFEETPLSEEKTEEMMLIPPPSGCQELPGIRRQCSSVKSHDNYIESKLNINNIKSSSNELNNESLNDNKKRLSGCCCISRSHSSHDNNLSSTSVNNSTPSADISTCKTSENTNAGSVQIQVNATVQLPPNVGQCVVNITATTNQSNFDTSINAAPTTVRSKNNFNGGGLIQTNAANSSSVMPENIETPTTPVSWLMPCPWGFEKYPQDKDLIKLLEVKRLLHTSGWYHEGLSWQQSENLLKNAPIGRWLMRDSSDSRYTFAISVQTARGPTSVRVHYLFGRFRLDSEPRLTLAMPLFDCPIKMLEYYVKYSTVEDNRREVWVDYSGQLYSQIYLTQPLFKQVRSLSHLARLVVNKNKLNTDHLPSPIKNYIAEYPYSF